MIETNPRTLNLNDLATAWRQSETESRRLASPLLADLRSLSMPTRCDPAGIPYRGTEVFRELMDGRSLDVLATAYVTLRRLNAQSGVLDAIETALGVADGSQPSEFE